MQNRDWIAAEVVERDLHDIPSTREPRTRVSHASFERKFPASQLLVRERKAVATVLILAAPSRMIVQRPGTR